jgi:biotin operon repressor
VKQPTKREWTEREDALLLKFRQHGLSIVDIAEALDRGQRSVETRLERLKCKGVPTHGVKKDYQPVTHDMLLTRNAVDGSRRLLGAILDYYAKHHGVAA